MKHYTDVIQEINAGASADLLTSILRETAARVLANERAGEVALILKIKPVKGSQTQAEVESLIKYKMPTVKGSKSEDATDSTLMHVSSQGDLSVTPHVEYSIPGTVTA